VNLKTKLKLLEALALIATIAAIVNLAMAYSERWRAGLAIGIVLAMFGYMAVFFFGHMMPGISYFLRKWEKRD
jgi:hypothetical protein